MTKQCKEKEKAIMFLNINLRVTQFGRVIFEIEKPLFPVEAYPHVSANEEVCYREPTETSLRIYEVQYQDELMRYTVPLSTA